MRKPPSNAGAIGALGLICAALAGGGLLLDFVADARTPFWVGAARGGGLAIGALAAIVLALLAMIARRREDRQGAADADA